ncbi:MAG TPA: oxidoreductase, partial [Pseudonocardia sp.]
MSAARPSDPLAPLLELPGVEAAARRARDAVVTLHHHPVNQTGWAASAAEAALRAARASAALDGARLSADASTDDGVVTDPVLAGAVRVVEATGRLLGIWRSAPLQALARLHLLAAADLTPDAVGRPAGGSERLALLAELVAGGTRAPAPVLAAVVHGELLVLRPFPSANGVVARAAARLTAIAAGLDPHG